MRYWQLYVTGYKLKWMIVGQLGLLLFIWFNIVLWGGSYFDSICVEGRLSTEQAETLNNVQWGKCPTYRNGDCEAEENDRILKHYCSSFLRDLFLLDTTKRIRRALSDPPGENS
jgi:hypothetical protein